MNDKICHSYPKNAQTTRPHCRICLYYIFFRHTLKLENENELYAAEITRFGLSLAAFARLNHVFKNSEISKTKIVYENCVLLIATYALETGTLTEETADRLRKKQREIICWE